MTPAYLHQILDKTHEKMLSHPAYLLASLTIPLSDEVPEYAILKHTQFKDK